MAFTTFAPPAPKKRIENTFPSSAGSNTESVYVISILSLPNDESYRLNLGVDMGNEREKNCFKMN